jgi:UDP-N-acetylglucosamine 2-epimerase (non-hydrolysing)
MKNYKIAMIIGTRAELIKIFPLMLELKNRGVPYYFIHTGQHNLKDLCEKLGVKKPDVVLTEESNKSSKFNSKQMKAILWNLKLISKIKKEMNRLKNLKYVLYHGDTMTTATASIATSRILNPFKKYKNVHLEAGLRSFNNFEPFPEEISRRIVGNFSDILFAVSDIAESNLKNKKGVIKTGNTILDSANIALEIAKGSEQVRASSDKNRTKENIKPLSNKKFALITIHRHENLKSKQRMQKIVEILSSLEIPSFFAMHDNTLEKIKEFGLYEELLKNKNIKIISPMDYPSFIYQLSRCSLIICDGGSMQEESLIFQKPCVILRKATERPEGLKSNFQFLSKLNVEETKEKVKEYLSPKFKIKYFKNPYGEMGVSKKIAEILK